MIEEPLLKRSVAHLLPQIPYGPLRIWRLTDFPYNGPPEPKGVRELEACLVLPSASVLHDRYGQPVPGSALNRGPRDRIEFPYGAPQPIDAEQILASAEELSAAIFLPFSNLAHFGHLLTEGAGWLWPFLDPTTRPHRWRDADSTLLIVDRPQGESVVDPISRALGIPRERIRSTSSLRGPLRCRRVLLPVPSMVNRCWIAPHHFEAVQHLLDRLHSRSATERVELHQIACDPAPQDKVYLSRSALGPDFRQLYGERCLEDELVRRGWRVVHPEQLSIRDQLRVLAHARTIAGELGSAFHLLMDFGQVFARKTVITLGVRRPERDPRLFNFVAQFRLQPVNFFYLACLGFVGRHHRRFLANPSRVADQLEHLSEFVDTC